jgi:hypothetical protein
MSNEWYNKKDIRTDSCENVTESYKSASIQVIVAESPGEYRVQLLTLLTLRQLAKWCRKIQLVMPPMASFNDILKEEIKKADPFAEFAITDEPISGHTITLFIGNPTPNFAGDYVVVNSFGWLSTCGFNRQSIINCKADINPILGASFAACLANAELFRYSIGIKSNPYVKWYSLWTNEVFKLAPDISKYGVPITDADFGKVHLVGCGAIGSSFIYLLPSSNCKGNFVLIDKDDHIEDHNTTSSLLFGYDDARVEKKKVICCSDYLKNAKISVAPFPYDFRDFKATYEKTDVYPPDVILCFANEDNVWSSIQNSYPPISIHASTSKSWGINIGRHIPLKDNCLVCSFKDYINSTFTATCAEVEISTEDRSSGERDHTAILPFLAPAAATVALSELVKIGLNKITEENLVEFNMGLADGKIVVDHQGFGRCHVCKDQVKLYPRFGETSKYWYLSSPE